MYDITDFITGGSEKVGGVAKIGKSETNYKGKMEKFLVPDNISECAIYLGNTETCMSGMTASSIGNNLGIKAGNKTEIVEQAKDILNCDSERCVLESMKDKIGYDIVEHEINTNLKIEGPTDNKLLSNVNIDGVLAQWALKWNNFYPYNFNMLNYASYSYKNGRVVHKPDTLATIQFIDLYRGTFDGKKYQCAACVINTDNYQGPGQHWMALFADARYRTGWTVEFFNSSGNSPAPEWVNWMEKTKTYMETIVHEDKSNIPVEMMKVSSIRHQKSRSECGLYSLFYIWARLNGVRPEYFAENHIPDQLMFEFRQHLFNDPRRRKLKSFDWSTYQNTVKVQWDS